MKTGIYIHSSSKTKYEGVERKISNQIRIFSNHYNIVEILLEKEETNLIKSILWRLPLGSYGRNYEKVINRIAQIRDFDFIYFRDNTWDRKTYRFFVTLKKLNKYAKIVLEIPTYPYSKELLSNFSLLPFYFKDIFYRRYTRKYIDRIVTFSEDIEIFKVPTIRIINGIIVDEVNCYSAEKDKTINLIAVASMRRVHGYERIIEGLREYKKLGYKNAVVFHLVGSGPRLKYYKKLVKKYKLEKCVIFYGNQTGDELENIYKKADIGLGSFRFNLVSSNLKVREYLAHGLPFVSSCIEDVIIRNPECKFFKSFPNDKSAINIQDIIDYYKNIQKEYNYNSNNLRKAIHEFAKSTVDLEETMTPIFNYLDI